MPQPRVLNILPDLSLGGGQVVVLRLSRVMAARGQRPLVAYCRPIRDLETEFRDADVELIDLGYRSITDAWRASQQLKRAIQDYGVNILQTHGTPLDKYFGHVAASSAHVCHVTTLHGNPPEAWRTTESGLRAIAREARNTMVFRGDWWLSQRTVRGIVAVSDAVLEAWLPILRSGGFDERADIEVIYSGIPMEEFSDLDENAVATLRAELLGPKAGPIIIGISRLWPGKDVDQLIDMMPRVLHDHPGAILIVVGEGPQRGEIEEQIRSLGLVKHVRLLGRRSDVPALLQASDLCVFPSKNEGFGLVALEALASAVPVVCFDLASLEKLTREVSALQVVHEPTVAALSSRVSQLLDDPEKVEKLGRQARASIAARWNVERSVDAYLSLYQRLLSRGGW